MTRWKKTYSPEGDALSLISKGIHKLQGLKKLPCDHGVGAVWYQTHSAQTLHVKNLAWKIAEYAKVDNRRGSAASARLGSWGGGACIWTRMSLNCRRQGEDSSEQNLRI